MMIDLRMVEKYRENNRIEAKKALGGLPRSIWETYSAFANTLGGVILLGVEEYRDKTFHVVDLPDPEGMKRELLRGLSDRKKVNINILSEKDITIEKYEGKSFIAVRVPRANRFDKPIYIDGNMKSGTYRRGGEGDYRCNAEEIEAMLRDASGSHDHYTDIKIAALNEKTLSLYSEYAGEKKCIDFLRHTGAVFQRDNEEFITTACLLMFGKIETIKEHFPSYKTLCRILDEDGEIMEETMDMNLYDFYFFVKYCLDRQICMLGKNQKEEKAIMGALNEALINSIIHGDYRISSPLSVEISPAEIIFANPGSLRILPVSAIAGGISDRRNEELARLFYLCGANTEMGGIKGIYEIWRKNKWCPPSIEERFSPDCVVLRLLFGKGLSFKENNAPLMPTIGRRAAVIGYITEHIEVTSADIASLLGVSRESSVKMLQELSDEDILTFEKRGKEYFYRLKS